MDGVIPEAKLSAVSGKARFSVRIGDARVPQSKEDLENFHDLLGELDARVEHFEATSSILDRLPEYLVFLKPEFSPSGPLSVRYTYRRAGDAPLRKEWLVQPEGMAGRFIDFSYPLHDVRGKVVVDTSAAPIRNITLDLSGMADNCPVTLKGTIKGPKTSTEVHLDIRGKGLILDDKVLQALPGKARKVTMEFLPRESRRLGLSVLSGYPMPARPTSMPPSIDELARNCSTSASP